MLPRVDPRGHKRPGHLRHSLGRQSRRTCTRSARPISPRPSDRRRRRIRTTRGHGGRLCRSTGYWPELAAGRARHRVSAACLASSTRHSGRRNRELCRYRTPYRLPKGGAGRGSGVRGERSGGGDSVPSRRPQRWRPVRLSLGRGTQARPAGKGSTRMNAPVNEALAITPATDVAGHVKALDWERVSQDLDAQGCAMIERLISPAECEALVELYPEDGIFRSRVVMGRHGFGRGEYKYFSYPLPDILAGLRTSIYPHLVPIANRWNTAMGIDVRYPAK